MNNENTIKCEHCNAILTNSPRSIGSHIGYWHKDVAKQIYNKPTKFSMKCLECNELVANSNNVLARHLRKIHNIDWTNYTVKHYHDGVWPICKCGCGNKLEKNHTNFGEFICGHSSRGEFNPMFGKKGDDNPNTGKVRNDSMKEKYSKAAKSRWDNPNDSRYITFKTEKYRSEMSASCKNAYDDPNVVARQSEGMRIWWSKNPQMRKVKSKFACELQQLGIIGPQAPYKAEWKFNSFTQKQEYMHSSWETRFLDDCIKSNNPVTKIHNVRITYIDPNGIERTYIPDFLSLDNKTLYEIKGRETEIDLLKYAAARVWCLKNNAQFEIVKYRRLSQNYLLTKVPEYL